jgi:pimeloyl-ACP methyl ester carboxylesterase
MATFVLVQPAWFGGWAWLKVSSRLRAQGHEVHCPTLTGLGERSHLAGPGVGLATHIDDVVALIEFEALTDVILVGSSSGGTVITGVADRVPDRMAAAVYLDAFLPADGQCTFDLLPSERRATLEGLVDAEGDGWLVPRFAPPPWPVIVRDVWQIVEEADTQWVLPRLRGTPVRHFTEPVKLSNPAAGDLARVYVRCLRNPSPTFDAAARTAQATPGWEYLELDLPHIPYVTHADEVTATLAGIADG